ncbi:hypothetical protein FHX42_002659 [Saccharopolyspora lacisalsi]|uniref:Uncharacterized protein n=1 Tax=Halosaccharopolyspora lacisalsi TaxID=1000566 RepID=A0A839E318_9PSEU|nr:hypothetical protein [Halosaccharopolyspora lacisalsi]MBA8825308.1 hypothetical protein [Halosaccharopolyspora lacisalsi]
MATTKREPKKVRSTRRRAAHHADRARRATTPVERYRAAQDALVSATAHSRTPARVARAHYDEVANHVRRVLAQVELGEASTALYEHKLTQVGTDLARLGAALMCLRGAIAHLPDTERDRLYEHYARYLSEEAHRINTEGGER